MRTLIAALLAVVVGGGAAQAQTVAGDRLRLNAGPCVITSQVGPPIKIILTGSCGDITTQGSQNLTLDPGGDLIVDPAGNDILPTNNYDLNIGMLSKKFLTLHAAELWVETLVAQQTLATIGGRILVAPTNTLTSDLAPATTSIAVKYNNFNNGDRVYMEANGGLEFMAITSAASGSGPYTYTVTRNLDGSGANQWYAGDALLDTGTTGNGFIDLYSTAGILASGSGPSIVGNVRTGTAYNAYAPRWAIGNLNGLYGYGVDTYGATFGDPAATNITIDSTNGIRIRSGTTNKLIADTSGNLSLVGDFSIGTAGDFRSGATSYSVGVGWWMDYNAGTPRFRIGNPAGQQLTWDGSTLAVTGTLTATTGTIGGWSINTTSLTATAGAVGLSSAITGGDDIRIFAGNVTMASAPFRVTEAGVLTATSGTVGGWTLGATAFTAGSGATTVGLDAGGSNPAIYAGSATPGSAPFRVTNTGALTAANATITGDVTATSGSIGGCTVASTTLTCGATVLSSSGFSAASGAVVIDGSGVLLAQGTGVTNSVNWSDGSHIYSTGDVSVSHADSAVELEAGGATLIWSSSNVLVGFSSPDLGQGANPWHDIYLSSDIHMSNPSTTSSNDYPMVYSPGNAQLYEKTDGYDGTCSNPTSIVIERGIVTGCS